MNNDMFPLLLIIIELTNNYISLLLIIKIRTITTL